MGKHPEKREAEIRVEDMVSRVFCLPGPALKGANSTYPGAPFVSVTLERKRSVKRNTGLLGKGHSYLAKILLTSEKAGGLEGLCYANAVKIFFRARPSPRLFKIN